MCIFADLTRPVCHRWWALLDANRTRLSPGRSKESRRRLVLREISYLLLPYFPDVYLFFLNGQKIHITHFCVFEKFVMTKMRLTIRQPVSFSRDRFFNQIVFSSTNSWGNCILCDWRVFISFINCVCLKKKKLIPLIYTP